MVWLFWIDQFSKCLCVCFFFFFASYERVHILSCPGGSEFISGDLSRGWEFGNL